LRFPATVGHRSVSVRLFNWYRLVTVLAVTGGLADALAK
jgi:hypothetical protein